MESLKKKMKIAVLGATGPSGQQLVQEALERGHSVKAIVRNPDKLTTRHDQLEVVTADIYNDAQLSEHFKGSDAVLSCLGCPPAWFSLRTISFYTDTAKPITAALRSSGVNRFIFMTAWYTEYSSQHPFFVNWVLKPIFLGPSTMNMGEMERYMEKDCQDLKYTAVRPTQLTNGSSIGRPLKAVEGQLVPEGGWTPRRDVAKFMLDCAESGDWVKKCVAIGV